MNKPLKASETDVDLQIVDCDIHPAQKSAADLYPFLEKRWIDHIESFGPHMRQPLAGQLMYPRMTANGMRVDAQPKDGPAGSSLTMLREQHLDPLNIKTGMLVALGRGGMEERNLDFAAALSHANNEWQLATLVDPEPRLKAGIVIAQDNPQAAVAEIEKRAGDDRFKQIIMSTRMTEPIGNRKYWPIYAAAEAANLPLGLHPTGYSGGHASTGSGVPNYYYQEHYTFVTGSQSLVTSLITEGVFEAFPKLRATIIEGGFSWAPSLAWRMDKHFETFRAELPHLKRKPSEYMRDHMWWTTQPIEEPPNGRFLQEVVDWIGWDHIMYSSDYPHWDYDAPSHVFRFPLEDWQKKAVFGGNATKYYGLT